MRASDSKCGAHCLRMQQLDVRVTSPPQISKHWLISPVPIQPKLRRPVSLPAGYAVVFGKIRIARKKNRGRAGRQESKKDPRASTPHDIEACRGPVCLPFALVRGRTTRTSHSERLFMMTTHFTGTRMNWWCFRDTRHLVIVTRPRSRETKAAIRERNRACVRFLLIECDG